MLRVQETNLFCFEQVRLVLPSHWSHKKAVKCSGYICGPVYNTKSNVHSSQSVHVSYPEHPFCLDSVVFLRVIVFLH